MMPRTSKVGSALVVVLWCVVVLSTVAYSSLRMSRLDIRVAKNFGDRVQARYLALAGIEKAKAVIHDVRTRERAAGERYASEIYDNATEFRDVEFGRGIYRVIRGRQPDEFGEPIVHGVLDEERFLDVNRAAVAELRKLPNMPPDVAAAVVDWRDPDQKVTDGGAEAEFYHGLRPPRFIRNAPFETVRELMLVSGVDPANLFGEDGDADGVLGPAERDGDRTPPLDNGDSTLDRGWAHYVTLESGVLDYDRYGEPRLDVSSATAEELAAIDGIDDGLADAIVTWRENRSLESVADLLDVQELTENPDASNANNNANNNPGNRNNNGDSNNSNGNNGNGNNNGMQPVGDKLIDTDLLGTIADSLSSGGGTDRQNVINVNTCGWEVLACLPGMNEDLARRVIEQRQLLGGFQSTAELLQVDGVSKQVFKQLAPRLDVRSGTFRILSEGLIPSTGARQRILVTVRFGEFEVETLSYREDL